MSGGGGFRVSIPSSVRKTIQNIKEITGNHGDEEVYAMLKECSMDPNETTQKLLHQDIFHEVKRKRDRKKENVNNNRELGKSRWRPGTQGRGGRGGRGNFAPRHVAHDAGGGRNSGPGKENGLQQGGEKGAIPLPGSHETKEKERSLVTSPAPMVSNGPIHVASGSPSVTHVSHIPTGSGPGLGLSSIGADNLNITADPADVNKNPIATPVNEALNEQPDQSTGDFSVLPIPTPTSTACFSPSDPVLLPSNDSRAPGAVGTIKREVGGQRPCREPYASIHVGNKLAHASEIGSSYAQGNISSKSQGVGKGQVTEFSQPLSTSTHVMSSISRPSSNYSNRSSQAIGAQKGGSNKEWKPKAVQGSGTAGVSEALTATTEATARSHPVSNVLDSEDGTSKLQKKLEDLHLRQRQHVILPNHIHVPESERTKLSFGSFGTFFGGSTSTAQVPESEKSSTPVSEASQDIEETVEEQSSSSHNALGTDEGDYSEHLQSPTWVPENLSSPEGIDIPSNNPNAVRNESKQNIGLPTGGHQYSTVQPFDPTNYHAQFYRTGAENDGRLSPFLSPGVAAKYNGNVAILPPPSSQSLQEGGVFSTGGPTPLVTQPAGFMQSSIAVTQQPLPVYRAPTGMHISHYPPNYFPYGHFIPPFYVPPPAVHQFLSNGAFPHQQPHGGGIYPAPPTVGAVGVKYSLPQYKQGTSTGNSAHIGMASGYGPYGSTPSGYNLNSAATAGNSTANEDLGQSQFKENNVYIAGQQSEGLPMWVTGPGRDISNLPTSSFYNLPPPGQHMAFTPAQAGHGTFAGIYHHPGQAVTAATVHPHLQQSQTMAGPVDMVGPGGGVYQQSQHTQINWPSNY